MQGIQNASRPHDGDAAARRRRSPGSWFADIGWRYLVGLLAIVYAGFPILDVVSASLARNGRLAGSNRFFGTVSGDNYQALSQTRFWQWVVNTLVVASVTAVATVLMGAAAAYAFSRFRFRGRRLALGSLLVIQMFPQLLAFVAVFLLLLTLQSEQNWTLAVGMYQWVSNQTDANWGLFAAGAVVSAVPVVALFLFLQKYIVGGLTVGSVK